MSPSTSKMSKDNAVKHIREHPGDTIQQLANATGLTRRYIRHLRQLACENIGPNQNSNILDAVARTFPKFTPKLAIATIVEICGAQKASRILSRLTDEIISEQILRYHRKNTKPATGEPYTLIKSTLSQKILNCESCAEFKDLVK